MPDEDGACPDCLHHIELHHSDGCSVCGCPQPYNPED